MRSTYRRDPIVVACAADEAYTKPLAAMVQSVLSNLRPGRALHLYVLEAGIPATTRALLTRTWESQGALVKWLAPRASAFAGVPLWGRMSVTTYFKLSIADLLPAAVTRAIWLDCDLVVVGDLAQLWDTPLDGYHARAAQDEVVPFVSSPCGIAAYRQLGFEAHAKYFNAGVMLLDVERWRRDDVTHQVLEYLREYRDRVYFWDQEGLNVALYGKWGELDARWNLNASIPRAFSSARNGNGVLGTPRGSWIVHYAGNLKPWRFPSRSAVRRLFFDYLDQTPWAGWRPRASAWTRALDLYDMSPLRRTFYPMERVAMRLVRAASLRYAGAASHDG
ncbi:MAG TPA: glycosyltransferase family 8 protein [Gemmatimonadaceae bacterium]